MQRNREKYAGIAFFALGIGCFVLAGLLVYLFSGKFADTPSGMKAGPALSFSSRSQITTNDSPSEPEPVHSRESGSETIHPRPLPAEEKWVLYITGEVVAPGVYTLPPGSRVFQLVEAAGGLTRKADPVRINLASPLADGLHVHVPGVSLHSPGQQPSPDEAPVSALPYSAPASFSPGPHQGSVALINLNTASAAELERIPGVGPVIARAIIEYRESRGRFSSVEDLLNVRGIGAKRLESMRSSLVVR